MREDIVSICERDIAGPAAACFGATQDRLKKFAPAYYHNYLLGELFASQLHQKIAKDVLGQSPRAAIYNGRPEVGKFLREKVFAPGRSLTWRDLARQATGEDLNPRAFAEAFQSP